MAIGFDVMHRVAIIGDAGFPHAPIDNRGTSQ
jgi:hypothetical protein